jgi:hypothetical protein
MTDELVKQLFTANIVTVLGVVLTFAIFFLSRGKGKATAAEAETAKIAQQNDGKLIDAVTTNAATNSKNAETIVSLNDSFKKLVDIQADTIEWHRKHDLKQNDTNGAILALTRNVKERSELDGEAIKELHDGLDTRLKVIETAVSSMYNIVQTLPNREIFSQELSAIERRLTSAVRLNSVTKQSTGTMAVVKVESISDPQLGSSTAT